MAKPKSYYIYRLTTYRLTNRLTTYRSSLQHQRLSAMGANGM